MRMVIARGSTKSTWIYKELERILVIMRKVMVDKVGDAAMYEQLAEECTELAKAALKASRQIRGDNPPRMTPKEIWACLEEEVADVWFCLKELDLKIDPELVKFKEERFLKAWEEIHGC